MSLTQDMVCPGVISLWFLLVLWHFDFITKLEDRSQKKKIMFLHSKNKASQKGYKGEC